MIEHIFDGTGYQPGDVALAILITFCAALTYCRVAFEPIQVLRMPAPRMMIALGFTLWAMRFWVTIWQGGDVIVAPLSMLAIGLIALGYSIVQLRAIRRAMALAKDPLFCLQMPTAQCQREDRVVEIMRRKDD